MPACRVVGRVAGVADVNGTLGAARRARREETGAVRTAMQHKRGGKTKGSSPYAAASVTMVMVIEMPTCAIGDGAGC